MLERSMCGTRSGPSVGWTRGKTAQDAGLVSSCRWSARCCFGEPVNPSLVAEDAGAIPRSDGALVTDRIPLAPTCKSCILLRSGRLPERA